ncbi:hypothetical protein HN51_043866 [Arachis hypogaea]
MVGKGHENFNSISEHGMTPIMDHYACMVTLIGRSSSVDKAVDLIKSMPHVPDYPIWSTPLSICAKKGDIKNAELAAGDVRSLMNKNNTKKFAAYSLVEVESEVHKFVSEDHTHSAVEKIYDELNRLISILQRIGYNRDTNIVLYNIRHEKKFKSISYHSEKLALAFALI